MGKGGEKGKLEGESFLFVGEETPLVLMLS